MLGLEGGAVGMGLGLFFKEVENAGPWNIRYEPTCPTKTKDLPKDWRMIQHKLLARYKVPGSMKYKSQVVPMIVPDGTSDDEFKNILHTNYKRARAWVEDQMITSSGLSATTHTYTPTHLHTYTPKHPYTLTHWHTYTPTQSRSHTPTHPHTYMQAQPSPPSQRSERS
jgi:hypothetical protein